MSEWFEDWFDTKEYLSVYSHRNEQDAKKLVDLILQNVNIPSGSKVLDMACGTGRHSILFAENGFYVTAVDLSKNLLEIAKGSTECAGVNINFVHSDLRSFCVNSKFNLVVNLFTSLKMSMIILRYWKLHIIILMKTVILLLISLTEDMLKII